MKRQQFYRHRLQTLAALQDAIGAMRSLSAHHFRRARQSLASARDYRSEMNTILAEIGIHQIVPSGGPPGMLLVASDLGLCGDYNSRLAQLAIEEAERHQVKRIYSVGHRVRRTLASRSLKADRNYEAPASLEGISRILLGLAQDILEDYLATRIGSLHVVSASFEGVGHFTPVSVCVLPLDPVSSTRVLRRSSYVENSQLMLVAVREFLYITLYEILLDALAAEHGMRLMAAESALEWLESTATSTARQLTSARSELSTQELLDIVSGSRLKLRRESS